MSHAADLKALASELRRTQRDLAALRAHTPVRLAVPTIHETLCGRVVGNNAITNLPLLGCNYATSAPASIPDYDPAAVPATVDGVGIAQIRGGGYVLFANYAVGTIVGSARDWPAGSQIRFLPGVTTQLPITASSPTAYKTLYIPMDWFGN